MIKNYKIDYHYLNRYFFMGLFLSIIWAVPINSVSKLFAALCFPSLFLLSKLLSTQLIKIEIHDEYIKLYYVFFFFFKWDKQLSLKTLTFVIKEVQAGRSLTRKNTELILADNNVQIIKISSEVSGWSKEILYQIYNDCLQNSQKN